MEAQDMFGAGSPRTAGIAEAPCDLRTNARTAPVGVESSPEFSWQLPAGGAGQAAYEIRVWTAGGGDLDDVVWCSGRTPGEAPFGVRYAGTPLASGQGYRWRVRVWTGGDEPGPWSDPAAFETGLLDPSRWRASWIGGPAPEGERDAAPVYLRSTVDLPSEVIRGRAYVSALGWYRFFVNGTDLTGPEQVPRWTPFHTYVEYQVYDVTDALRSGANVLAMVVADGRFRGANGMMSTRNVFGDRVAGLVQLELDLADGTTTTVVTDSTWQAGPGRILFADPKFGERVDLRRTDEDWLTRPEPPARFTSAEVLDEQRVLIGEEVGRVRAIERLPARSITRTPSGKQLVDFGQNFTGVVRIKLSGPTGRTVRLTHSEVLGRDGELDVDYIHQVPFVSRWYQRDEVILDGSETWWSPWFTIHGFRYVEVDGLPGDLEVADVEGVVLSTEMPATGEFECSDDRLNRLHENVRWSLRSNFVDTPTDCPTRERSGWTGDIQVFGPTAATMVDVQAYLRRYLRNVAAEQFPDGAVPVFVPMEIRGGGFGGRLGTKAFHALGGSVGWGDVTVLLPWTMYRYYGDRQVLEQQYSSMTAWVDQLARRAYHKRSRIRRGLRTGRPEIDRYILDTGFHFGEWLRPGEAGGMNQFLDGALRGGVVATAYLEHSARTLSRIAGVLGRTVDATRYRDLADRTRRAWRAVFLRPDGRIGTDRQDDYVRALGFDLLEPAERPAAVERLVRLVERAGDHLGTGFLSTAMLLPALVEGGRADVAWRLLLQNTSPSWLYQVERGATTVWETWEGYKQDGTAAESHNHYALGAVANFLTEHVAGLAPAEPGYRTIDVRPLIGGGLTRASTRIRTPYGVAASSWTLSGDDVVLEVTVPPGATARVHRGPDASPEELDSGTHSLVLQRADVDPAPNP